MDPVSFLFWRFYYFFRDPKRTIPTGNVVVSPADGYVLYIHKVEAGKIPSPVKNGMPINLSEWIGSMSLANSITEKKEFLSSPPSRGGISTSLPDGVLIGIYMAPTSVHYNRAPVSGRVSSIINRPAKGKNLSMSKALIRLIWDMPPYEQDSIFLTENARNTIFMAGDIPIAVIRIADRYVSEVDCYVSEGDILEKGAKIGMIRMGSQCDLFIPDSSNSILR